MKYLFITILFLFSFGLNAQTVFVYDTKGEVKEMTFQEVTDFVTRYKNKVEGLRVFSDEIDVNNLIIQYPLLNEKMFLIDGDNVEEVSIDNDSREIKIGNKKGEFYFSSNVSTLFFDTGDIIEFERSGSGWSSSDGVELVDEIEPTENANNDDGNTEIENPLYDKFDGIIIDSESDNEAIVKLVSSFTENELISLGTVYGFDWTTAGSKKDKAILLLGKYMENN